MPCEEKLTLRSDNASYCLIEVVTKAGLTVCNKFSIKLNLESAASKEDGTHMYKVSGDSHWLHRQL